MSVSKLRILIHVDATKVFEGIDAAAIQSGEADPELSTCLVIVTPGDLALYQDLAASLFKPEHQRGADGRQVAGADVHPAPADLNALGFERWYFWHAPADLDQGLHPHTLYAGGTAVLVLHLSPPGSRGLPEADLADT